ncbi:unnamed protein product, partial [Brachionus calyciflorus]
LNLRNSEEEKKIDEMLPKRKKDTLSKFKNFYLFIILLFIFINRVRSTTVEFEAGDEKTEKRYQVAKFNFAEVSSVYAITLWILIGSLAKIGFHLFHKITDKIPESCLLIIIGLIVGGLFYASKVADEKSYVLNSATFFLFLLPPIILEAGYFMPNRPFFNNVGTILILAFLNTIFNTFTIGFTLWGFSFTPLYGGVKFGLIDCMVFASLISSVDPVAVLATFVEINVNDMLYIIVFGESLLNDGVSVVLYRLFYAFAEIGQENIIVVDGVLGCVSFLVVALGGTLIGIIFGLIASFTTKYTEKTPVLEPLIVITIAYLSYLTAEMTSTSSILAITACGMFMKQYVEFNVSKKSNATIEFILKMAASIMETIIFMFMGLSTISDQHSWNTGFVLITIVCCCVYRFIGVLIFANLSNSKRLMKLQFTDMLIMSYGGIRGAIAFALALVLDENKIPRKKEFVTATIAVVMFTVFVQGTTIGALVNYLKIKRKETEEPTASAKLTNRLIDHVMSSLEVISGVAGKHATRNKVRQFDRKYLKPLLLREFLSNDEKLLVTFKKINELNMARMAENPKLSQNNNSNQEFTNISLEPSGVEENVTSPIPSRNKRRLTIFPGSKSSKPKDDIKDLLDTAMYTAERRPTLYFPNVDDEDNDEYLTRRRKSRSGSVFNFDKRRESKLASINLNRRKSKSAIKYIDEVNEENANDFRLQVANNFKQRPVSPSFELNERI